MDITDRALGEMKRLLTENTDYSYARLRLLPNGKEAFGLGIDIEMPDDEIIEYEGSGLLVVDKEVAANLDGLTIDVDETPEGKEIVIDKH